MSPPGVLPRYLFTLGAILVAWFLAMPRPFGDGLGHAEVCDRQGADRPAAEMRSGRPRWRSLARWSRRLEDWWPSRPVLGSTWFERTGALLVGFLAGGGDRSEAVARAVRAHAAAGKAM